MSSRKLVRVGGLPSGAGCVILPLSGRSGWVTLVKYPPSALPYPILLTNDAGRCEWVIQSVKDSTINAVDGSNPSQIPIASLPAHFNNQIWVEATGLSCKLKVVGATPTRPRGTVAQTGEQQYIPTAYLIHILDVKHLRTIE